MNIKQAVAEALHECPPACVAARGINDRVAHAESDMLLAAAILATPQMQAIARQAAIGAAVERLEEASATKVLTVTVSPAGWSVSWWDRVWHTFDADTLPAAIASALGEDA